MAEKGTDMAKREERQPARRDSVSGMGSPFHIIERFSDEMDRLFDDFGLGRGRLAPRIGRNWLRWPSRGIAAEWQAWLPEIEVFHRNDELVVHADLPGLNKDDVKVDVTENGIAIQGERKQDHKEEREGVYRSERSYGSFFRAITLPDGAITDQAKANFKDGVPRDHDAGATRTSETWTPSGHRRGCSCKEVSHGDSKRKTPDLRKRLGSGVSFTSHAGGFRPPSHQALTTRRFPPPPTRPSS